MQKSQKVNTGKKDIGMPLFLVATGHGAKPHTVASFENYIHEYRFNFMSKP